MARRHKWAVFCGASAEQLEAHEIREEAIHAAKQYPPSSSLPPRRCGSCRQWATSRTVAGVEACDVCQAPFNPVQATPLPKPGQRFQWRSAREREAERAVPQS